MDHKKIAIVSGPLAPYRLDLYSSLGRELASEFKIDVIYGQKSQVDHGWSDLHGHNENYRMLFAPCKRFPKWVTYLLRKLKIGKGYPRLPSRRTWKVLKESKPDVIWLCEFNPYTLFAVIFAKLNNVQLWVATDLGATNHPGDANAFSKYICAIGTKFVDVVLACTPHATRPLWQTKAPIIFIPHSVRNSEYSGFRAKHKHGTKDIPIILFVGNCIYRKGVDLLVRALSEVKRNQIDFHLRIVGGADNKWLQDIVESCEIDKQISYSGFVEGDNLKDEYANADLFVLPSRHDTYAVVSHEAAICGLPLILSKNAGSSEVLVDDANGYVVDPEDIGNFASKITEFLISSEKRAKAGQASIALASQWGTEENAKRVKTSLKL